MKSTRKIPGRLSAVMLIAALASCESGEQQTQATEPQAAQPADTPAAAPAASAPEEDRFANMFVSEVTETFNPGIQVGSKFPAIRGMYDGEEITTIDRFIRDRGMIFIAMRSVDW